MEYKYNYRSVKVKEGTMNKIEIIRAYMGERGYSLNKGTCIDFIASHIVKLIKEKTKAENHATK